MSSTSRVPRLLDRPPRDELESEARAMLGGAEEPLPDDLRARVRDGFMRRLEGPSAAEGRARHWRVAAMALAAAAAVVLAIVVVRRPVRAPEGRVLEVRGVAGMAEGADGWKRIDGDSAFEMPARLRVKAGASAEVRLARGVDIRVSGPALLRLGHQGIEVDSGRAVHSVQKGHGRWVVQLGAYSVVVKGTQFWTARRDEEAAVCLLEGKVQVRLGPELLSTLSPGEAWRSSPSAPAFPSDLACRVVGGERDGAVAAAPVRGGLREGALGEPAPQVTLAREPEARDADSARTPAVDAAEPTALQGAVASHEARAGETPSREPVEIAEAPSAVPAPEPSPPVPSPARASTELPLPEAAPSPPPPPEPERAPCAGVADPEACFRDLANGADLRAQAALYRLGEVRRARGNAQGALDAWLEYRSRFPAGALAQEADLAILEIRLRLGQQANALRAAGRFLEHWPASEHAAEVTALRGVLRQRGGDCAGALGDFDHALGARVSAGRREEALFGRAACLETAGRTGDAANAYRAYLRERPDGRFATRAREALDTLEHR